MAEEMLNLNQEFAETERIFTFAALQKEFEETQLLNQLKEEDESTDNQPGIACRRASNS